MYKLIGSPGSRLTRATWMLQELGEEYEIIVAKPHSDEIKKYNPSGKGPALADGEIVVIDSAAICTYLGDKHADKNMSAPPATAERASLDSWIHFSQNDLEAPLWLKARHTFILPEAMRLDVRDITRRDFAHAVTTMETRLGDNEFALGDRFTSADVLLGHTGSWARNAKFEIKSDTVNAYFDRVLSRPALARARAIENNM